MIDYRKLLLDLIHENKIDAHDALDALLEEVCDPALRGFLEPFLEKEGDYIQSCG